MCEEISRRAEEYFSSLNSMTRRIMVDTDSLRIRSSRPTPANRPNGKDEDFFAPKKVREKYAFYPRNDPDVDCFPKLCIRSGGKYVVDEDSHGKGSGCSWRDEHSGPFIWETQSQLDLSFVGTEDVQTNNCKPNSPAVLVTSTTTAEKPNGILSSSKSKLEANKVDLDGSSIKDDSPGSPSPKIFLTKKMEKQLSGKCFEKAPPNMVLPPLPDKPPPVVPTNKPSGASVTVTSMKCPPPKPPSKKQPLSSTSSAPPNSENKKSEFKKHPVIRASTVPISEPQTCSPVAVIASVSKNSVPVASTKVVETAQIESLKIDLSPSDDIPKTGFDFLDNW